MTADRDLDRRLVSWLDGHATQRAPDGLLQRSLARVETTRQRPAWLVRDRGSAKLRPGRIIGSRMLARIVAAAVISVLAVGGALYLADRDQPAVGGPHSTIGPNQPPSAPTLPPTPSPTPAPTPAPTATPKPDPTALTGRLGAGRQIHTATTLADGRVLVAGGIDAGDLPLASATLYDPATGSFSRTGSLVTARAFDTATLLRDGRVLFVGGGPATWTHPGPNLASAELYDPATGRFRATGLMAITRQAHTATRLRDGRVLIVGGNDDGDHAVASAELYDPTTGRFSPTGSMTFARAFHTATLLADGRVLITGGSPSAWSWTTPLIASAELYDPRTGTFTVTGSMISSRAWHTATLLAGGSVLVTGGTDNAGVELAATELFNPKTDMFTRAGSMAHARTYHAATLLADGRVLVAGGGGDYTNREFLASAEIYDPTSGTFTTTGSMTEARTYQAANLLPDGRVLVTGGYGDLAPLASAEIYDPSTGVFRPTGSVP